MTPDMSPALEVRKGTCFALFAYEVGLAIKLDDAERRTTSNTAPRRCA